MTIATMARRGDQDLTECGGATGERLSPCRFMRCLGTQGSPHQGQARPGSLPLVDPIDSDLLDAQVVHPNPKEIIGADLYQLVVVGDPHLGEVFRASGARAEILDSHSDNGDPPTPQPTPFRP